MTPKPIVLAKDTISHDDYDCLADWLRTYPRLTKGELTQQFEQQWAHATGSRYAVFVNSGSSANLLALYSLKISERLRNNRVVVPALCWITDIAPVLQFGMEPILCDINLNDLSVDLNHLEDIFKKDKPAILLLVSVLGLVPDMDALMELCERYGVIVIEDTCESLGSKYRYKNLGTFGLMGTFSLYFGHHLSTIEGGMINTDDEDIYDRLIMLRSHGWARDLSTEKRKALKDQWQIGDFNELYTFYVPGFNVRSTDLQAFLGMRQLQKLDQVVDKRNRNYAYFNKHIKTNFWKPKQPDADNERFVSNMGYPIIHPKRNVIVGLCKEHAIEVRPLISGTMGKQPFYRNMLGKTVALRNADFVDQYGMYIPNHACLTDVEMETMCNIINKITGYE